MSKSDLVRQVLAEATEPLSTDEITAACGWDEEESTRTAALLNHLAQRGEVRNLSTSRRSGGIWERTRSIEAAPPVQKEAARAAQKPADIVAVATPAAPAIRPPGSMAIADDGSVLLIDGDRIVNRLTAEQVRNVAALAARFQA